MPVYRKILWILAAAFLVLEIVIGVWLFNGDRRKTDDTGRTTIPMDQIQGEEPEPFEGYISLLPLD